jgi:predicted kinase
MERLQLWWNLAGPAAFVGKIVRSVVERRRGMCIATPSPRPDGLTVAIKDKLRSELSLECIALNLSERDQSQSIAHLLGEYLEVPVVEIGSVGDFASHPKLADQVIVLDGIDRRHLRRWGLFLRQLDQEQAGEAIVGPIIIVLVPIGLAKEQVAELCGPHRLLSSLGIVDRYDTASYAAGVGSRSGDGLSERVGHAVMLDVAAWSRDLLEKMITWDVADQIDPLALLERAADQTAFPYPCWENGLVDLWDDEPVAHAVAALRFGFRDHVKRRIWSAQASVLLPFTFRILRALIARYYDTLQRQVSPANPPKKRFGDREVEITDPWKLEFYDFRELTKQLLSPAELELTKIAGWTRNAVAHRDVVRSDSVSLFSDHYEANREILEGDVPGWNWPRCGQTMTLTVGPPAAGKSTWAVAQGIEVVSSDEIRKDITPDGEIPGSQAGIFKRVRASSSRVLAAGRDVIVDAMHVEVEHRRRQLGTAPLDIGVRYVIIDRPLADKQRDAGWRSGRGLVEKYDQAFPEKVKSALNGDGNPRIEVVDLRQIGS